MVMRSHVKLRHQSRALTLFKAQTWNFGIGELDAGSSKILFQPSTGTLSVFETRRGIVDGRGRRCCSRKSIRWRLLRLTLLCPQLKGHIQGAHITTAV